MREIVLDTETTGFEPSEGHRLVEIGCIELINRVPSGNQYHQYVNPERDMPESAFKVHGLSQEFLSDKPRFGEIAQSFLDFIGEAPLVIHNAAFDMKFLNAELARFKQPELLGERAIDTLMMARKKYPGAQNSLDALCRRFDIDNSNRDLHGALIDAYLLAEVYLELTGGRQPDLVLHKAASPGPNKGAAQTERQGRPKALVSRLSKDDEKAHSAFIAAELGPKALWLDKA